MCVCWFYNTVVVQHEIQFYLCIFKFLDFPHVSSISNLYGRKHFGTGCVKKDVKEYPMAISQRRLSQVILVVMS
jgi:hypothetical protein